jgi:hypothetical protein
MPSPLLGYNTNVRHKGKLYHIQTEDSGVNHPHIITHLFADGGRIIASKKTTYAEHLGADNLKETVKRLMQEQHKAMFIDLRDCVYDEDEAAGESAPGASGEPAAAAEAAAASVAPDPATRSAAPTIDIDALERAAEAKLASSAAAHARPDSRRAGRYRQTLAAREQRSVPPEVPASDASIFGGQVLRGKSLDDVILSYLADDMDDEK